MSFLLDRPQASISIVDAAGRMSRAFSAWLDKVLTQIETQDATQDGLLDEISEILGLTSDLEAAVETAQTAAAEATAAAEGTGAIASLTNSGTTGLTLTAADAGPSATITVSAHTRVYGDGSTLAISGPTDITGLAYATDYYVYYDDPTRGDTTPAYQTTTSETTAAQTGDRHLVGVVTTPAALAPPTDGDVVLAPGLGSIQRS